MDFPERDWKQLRALHPVALERYCERVLDECLTSLQLPRLSAHERYIRLFRQLKDRDRDLAIAFDDMRRSRATQRLAAMVHLGLVSEEELTKFSLSTQATVLALVETLEPEGKRRGSKR